MILVGPKPGMRQYLFIHDQLMLRMGLDIISTRGMEMQTDLLVCGWFKNGLGCGRKNILFKDHMKS